MKRFIAMTVLALLLPLLATAKDAQESWDNLKQLTMGQQIRVVLDDVKSYSGAFRAVTEEAIVVRTDAGDQRFEKGNVLRVSTKGKSYRLRNTMIGLAVGAGVGAAIAAGANDDPESREIAVPVGIVVGLGGGAGIGAAIPTGGWRDVYRAPKREMASAR